MRLLSVPMSTLALAPVLLAQRVAEIEPNGTVAQAQVVAIGSQVDAQLAIGEQDWYQFTVAAETHVFAAHGTPRDVEVVAVSWNGSLARLEFQRSEPAAASCVLAVVESGVLDDGGFEVLDVAPRGFTGMSVSPVAVFVPITA